MFTDRSFLIGQKLVENAKVQNQKWKCDILSNFQTMWFWRLSFLVKHVHKAINLVFDEVRGGCKPCLHDLRYVEETLKRAKIWKSLCLSGIIS